MFETTQRRRRRRRRRRKKKTALRSLRITRASARYVPRRTSLKKDRSALGAAPAARGLSAVSRATSPGENDSGTQKMLFCLDSRGAVLLFQSLSLVFWGEVHGRKKEENSSNWPSRCFQSQALRRNQSRRDPQEAAASAEVRPGHRVAATCTESHENSMSSRAQGPGVLFGPVLSVRFCARFWRTPSGNRSSWWSGGEEGEGKKTCPSCEAETDHPGGPLNTDRPMPILRSQAWSPG